MGVPWNAENLSEVVIASEAKQSILLSAQSKDWIASSLRSSQ
jgi:hypothetical protein